MNKIIIPLVLCVIVALFIANIPEPTAAMYAISHDVPTNILIGGIDDSENRWIVGEGPVYEGEPNKEWESIEKEDGNDG